MGELRGANEANCSAPQCEACRRRARQAVEARAEVADGTVVGWGNNASGQTNVPTGLTNVVAIAANGDSSLALKANGTVVTWGQFGGAI